MKYETFCSTFPAYFDSDYKTEYLLKVFDEESHECTATIFYTQQNACVYVVVVNLASSINL